MSDQHLELVVLIHENIPACRLIVTWPKAFLEFNADLTKPPGELLAEDPFAQKWARLATVDQDDVEREAPMLFGNALLFDDGAVSDVAMGYIKSQVVELVTG